MDKPGEATNRGGLALDSHVHTPLCGHATGTPCDYVHAAAARGIRHLTFTCHIPMADDGFGGPRIRMDSSQMPQYRSLVQEAAELGRTLNVEVLFGIEAEWFPEEHMLTAMDELLAAWPFDFVIGSIHPHLRIYKAWFARHGIVTDHDKARVYFEHVLAAAESRRYDTMAHLDIVRCYGTVEHFDPASHEAAVREILQTLARLDVSLEINTSGLFKPGLKSLHPDPMFLQWAREYPLHYTLGSDAHAADQVGQGYATAGELADHACRNLRLYRRRVPVAFALHTSASDAASPARGQR